MGDMEKFMAWGLLLNSAIYVIGVFVAGLITRNEAAWKVALITAGFCYLGYAFQLAGLPRSVCGTAVAGSVVAGVAAGIFLLVR